MHAYGELRYVETWNLKGKLTLAYMQAVIRRKRHNFRNASYIEAHTFNLSR